jgi:hypothetical protein
LPGFVRLVSSGLLVAAFCSTAFSLRTARGEVIITAPTVSLPYSASDRTETVEVYVQDTDNPSPQVGDQQVELALPSSPDVFFTSAGATVDHPYLFAPQAPVPNVTSNVVYGTDYPYQPPYDVSPPVLADGDGLLMVQLTVKGGTVGDFPLTFNLKTGTDAVGTALFDQLSDPIAFTVQNGWIDIAPAPVPEPSGIALAGIAVAAGLIAWRRRARLRRPAEAV